MSDHRQFLYVIEQYLLVESVQDLEKSGSHESEKLLYNILRNAKLAKFSCWFLHYQDSNGRKENKFFNEGLISEKEI